MVADPAGLLRRIAELRPLCEDPAIAAAVESGDPFRVYRALVWARLTGRLKHHQEALDVLVHRRRLFAKALDGSPTLATFNFVGAAFVGTDEAEADGSYVTTHFVVALVPVFPLGAYLVRSAGGNAWNIFARVPLGLAGWLWSRGVALAAVLAVAAGAAQAFHASGHHRVWVVNGLDTPVRVTAGAQALTVSAGGRAELTLPVGRQALRAEGVAGQALDSLTAEIRSSGGELLWNVAGAAPVYRRDVIYGGPDKAEPPSPTVFCGQRWVELPPTDYLFVEPPSSLKVRKGAGPQLKTALGVGGEPGWTGVWLCIRHLLDRERLAEAVPLITAYGESRAWKGQEALAGAVLIAGLDFDGGLALADRVRAASPDDVEVHRHYQGLAQYAGRTAELRAEYEARAAAAPDSGAALYLALRLLPATEATPLAERGLERFPGEPYLLGLAMLGRSTRDDWAGTLAAWNGLPAGHPMRESRLELAATALVAQGHAAEAASLVDGEFRANAGRGRGEAAELYARIEALRGEGDADRLLLILEQKGPRSLERLRTGLGDDGALTTPGSNLLRAIGTDPDRALRVAAEAPDARFPELDPASWGLAYGEAVRRGDEGAARVLRRGQALEPELLGQFERYVRGEAASLPGLPAVLRAAAALVRSRTPGLPERERRRLVAAARADDWLRTNVTRAVDGWTRPAAGR